MKSLLLEQILLKQLSSVRASKTKVYNLTIPKNTDFNVDPDCDIGADFQALFSADTRVVSSSGFIRVTGNVYLKFNSVDSDFFWFDVTSQGYVYTWTRGDLRIDKLCLANQDYADDVDVEVVCFGDFYARVPETD